MKCVLICFVIVLSQGLRTRWSFPVGDGKGPGVYYGIPGYGVFRALWVGSGSLMDVATCRALSIRRHTVR